jgi:chromosome segregation ATPase
MQIPKSFTFWAIVAIAVLAFVIGMLTCNSKKNPEERTLYPTTGQIDSMNAKKAKEKAYVDSLALSLNKTKRFSDSLKAVVSKQSDVIAVKNLKITALTKEAELYRKYNDTASYITACDSLLPQISDLSVTVDLYRENNSLLMDSISRLEDQRSLLNARQEFYQGELQASYDKLSSNSLQLESINRKLQKKASRKWAINLGASYIFDGQQWRYGAGISVGRTLVRF